MEPWLAWNSRGRVGRSQTAICCQSARIKGVRWLDVCSFSRLPWHLLVIRCPYRTAIVEVHMNYVSIHQQMLEHGQDYVPKSTNKIQFISVVLGLPGPQHYQVCRSWNITRHGIFQFILCVHTKSHLVIRVTKTFRLWCLSSCGRLMQDTWQLVANPILMSAVGRSCWTSLAHAGMCLCGMLPTNGPLQARGLSSDLVDLAKLSYKLVNKLCSRL